MDISKPLKNVSGLISKYKYALAILLLGVFLMLLPKRQQEKAAPQPQPQEQQEQISVETQLANILSQVKGAGKVEVMLTVKEGEEIFYQTDTNAGASTDTVIVSDKNRTQSALVRQVYGPKYQGAIILCSGANDPTVRLAMVDAVSKITGLGADKISILELK